MSKEIDKKYLERINQLLKKADKVKETHTPNPPGVLGGVTLNFDIFNEWKVSCKNLLEKLVGRDSSYYEDFIKDVKYAQISNVDLGIGILRGLNEDLEMDMLSDIKNIAFAEIFTDFLEMAQHLLDNNYKDPAAFLTGAVLEDGLRKVCQKNGIQIRISDDISALNSKLSDKNIYTRLTQSQIQTWKKLRDNADHGNFQEYTIEQVKEFLTWTRKFLSEYF